MADALSDLAAVLTAVQDVWDATNVSGIDSSAGSPGHAAFSLTLVGPLTLALRANVPAFSVSTLVSVGSVACNSSLVSSDGKWLVVETPQQTCSGSSGDCGYLDILLANPPGAFDTGPDASTMKPARMLAPISPGAAPYRGSMLSCPPFCPGSASIVPIAVSDGAGGVTFEPAFVSLSAGGTAVVPVSAASVSAGQTGV